MLLKSVVYISVLSIIMKILHKFSLMLLITERDEKHTIEISEKWSLYIFPWNRWHQDVKVFLKETVWTVVCSHTSPGLGHQIMKTPYCRKLFLWRPTVKTLKLLKNKHINHLWYWLWHVLKYCLLNQLSCLSDSDYA